MITSSLFKVVQLLQANDPVGAQSLLASFMVQEERGQSDLQHTRYSGYLTAWAALLREQWDQVRTHLQPLLPPSLLQFDEGEPTFSTQTRLALSWLRLGSAAQVLGEADLALRQLQAGLSALQPRNIRHRQLLLFLVRLSLAHVYIEKGNAREALKHLHNATVHAPDDLPNQLIAQLHRTSAEAFRLFGEYEAMVYEIEEALRSSSDTLSTQAELYLYLSASDVRATPEQQLEWYTTALELADRSGSPNALLKCSLALARFHRVQGGLDTARSFAAFARTLVTTNTSASNTLRVSLESSLVAVAEAKHSSSNGDRVAWYEQALSWVQQGERFFQGADDALVNEVLTLKAQIFEALGYHEDALTTYKTLRTVQKAPSLFADLPE